jgi:cytochrome bd-type quinol oxidase subunit 2
MANSNDPLKDSCGYALDLIKQFLTLSAAGIAFVVGLVYADKPGKIPASSVAFSLSLLGLSFLCGWLSFMGIVGKVNKRQSYDIYDRLIQAFCALQILLFCGGVLILFFPTLHTAKTQQDALAHMAPPTPSHP